jgi:hypothetical protein
VLRDKGVLRVEHGAGTFVNPPEQWSALDAELLASRTALEGGSAGLLAEQVLEARRVVEVGIAGLARSGAPRSTSTGWDRRRPDAATHEADDVVGFSVADSAFHDGVMQAAANPFLTALFDPIRTLAEQVRITTSYEPDNRRRRSARTAASSTPCAAAIRGSPSGCVGPPRRHAPDDRGEQRPRRGDRGTWGPCALAPGPRSRRGRRSRQRPTWLTARGSALYRAGRQTSDLQGGVIGEHDGQRQDGARCGRGTPLRRRPA